MFTMTKTSSKNALPFCATLFLTLSLLFSKTSACADVANWKDSYGDGCEWYIANDEFGCPTYGNYFDAGMGTPNESCCYCQGLTYYPTSSPTVSPTTASPSSSPSTSPTTASPTGSPTVSPTMFPTSEPTAVDDVSDKAHRRCKDQCDTDQPGFRTVCHRAKRINGVQLTSKCMSPEKLETHFDLHPKDSCGCCPSDKELNPPSFCMLS